METVDLAKKDLNTLAELFPPFWEASYGVENMAVMFERLSEDPDYILLAAN